MTRQRLTTTQRGLGGDHQAERKRQLALLRDGDLCPFCWRGMYRGQLLDLDDWPGRAYGGRQVKRLAHRSCNRRAGQAITSAILRVRANARRRAQW